MIIGYKCFKKGLINHYGMKFEVGKTYHTTGPIKFGNYGNGFHMCKFFYDTFRYFTNEEEPVLCLVEGSGKLDEYDDDYYGYYSMYAVENIKIIRIIERKEIIELSLKLPNFNLIKILQTFKLTKEEILLFKDFFKNNAYILKAISRYQEDNLSILSRKKKDK